MLQEYPAQIQPRSSSTRALHQQDNGMLTDSRRERLSEDRTTATTASSSTSTSAMAVVGTTTATATTAEADITTDKIDAEASRILIDLANQDMSTQIIFNDSHNSSSVGSYSLKPVRRKRSVGPPRKASLPIRTDSNYHLQLDRQPPDPIMLLAAAAAVVDDDFNGRYYERREIRLHGRHGAKKRKSYTYGTTASTANKAEDFTKNNPDGNDHNNAATTSSSPTNHKIPVHRRHSERRNRTSYTPHTRRTASFANKQDYTENWVDASTATANISKELEEDLTRAIELAETATTTARQSTQRDSNSNQFINESTAMIAERTAVAPTEPVVPPAPVPTPSTHTTSFSYQYLSMKQNPRIKRNAMHAYITYMIYTDMARSKQQSHPLFMSNDEPRNYTYTVKEETQQQQPYQSNSGGADIPHWYSPPSSQHYPPYQHSNTLPPPPTLPTTQSYRLPPSPRLSHPSIHHDPPSIPAPPLPSSNNSSISNHDHTRRHHQMQLPGTSSSIAVASGSSISSLHQHQKDRPLGRPLTDFLFNSNSNSNDTLKKKDILPPPPPPPALTLPAPSVPTLPPTSSFMTASSSALMTSPRPTSTLF